MPLYGELTIEDVVNVARRNHIVALSSAAYNNVQQASEWVANIVAEDEPVYGINTGFGIFADRSISRGDAAKLSRNLILSHAVGTGAPLPNEVVRAAMLIRVNTLAKGNSGVRPIVIETLLAMLNRHVTPEIPSRHPLLPLQASRTF